LLDLNKDYFCISTKFFHLHILFKIYMKEEYFILLNNIYFTYLILNNTYRNLYF